MDELVCGLSLIFCVLQAFLLLSGVGHEECGEEQSCCQLDFIQL